jgi:hypothetical protein
MQNTHQSIILVNQALTILLANILRERFIRNGERSFLNTYWIYMFFPIYEHPSQNPFYNSIN